MRNFIGNGEPETKMGLIGPAFVASVEAPKDQLFFGIGNSCSVVDDREYHSAFGQTGA